MVFSSEVFLFFFLPITLAGYYLISPTFRHIGLKNGFLLLASLFFYAWGEPKYVLLLLASILGNYVFGLLVDRFREVMFGKISIVVMLVFNLGILFVFKYLDFSIRTINQVAGRDVLMLRGIVLPIGISFITFQAISYVIDVYRGDGQVQKNPMNVALYIALFPQLIAGPIVRYQTVAEEIRHRSVSMEDVSEGIGRFVLGLSKKVLLANNVAAVAEKIYGLGTGDEVSVLMSWMASIAYTLQIYFDFSGYSDMAIGLGRMLGFHFEENFQHPYISGSVTEFWRRWHISLSSWFRDYVYIPLGGSRRGKGRTYLNLAVVWLLTGIWHGANWNFILWGLFYLVLLVIEKTLGPVLGRNLSFSTALNRICKVLYRILTLVFVNIGWILFNRENLSEAWFHIRNLFGLTGHVLVNELSSVYLRDCRILFLVAMICCLPILSVVKKWETRAWYRPVRMVVLGGMFALCVAYISRSSYDPFIYFNF